MLKILLIEDDLIDQMTVTRFLKKNVQDYSLKTTDHICVASDWLRQSQFDLVLCDMHLIDGSAFDLQSFFLQQRFVILTGHLDSQLQNQANQLGIQQIVEKKHNLDHLRLIFNNPPSPTQPATAPSTYSKTIQHLLRTFDQNPNYAIEMIELFLLENPKMLDALHQAGQENDTEQIQKMAHKIKSGYQMMSLQELYELAKVLELEPFSDAESYQVKIQQLLQLTQKAQPNLEKDLQILRTISHAQ